MHRPRRLDPRQFPQDTTTLARWLLGKLLVRHFGDTRAIVRLVETEGYVQNDPACHAFAGRTARNDSLFLAPGHAYVYFCYGAHWLLNVSSEPAGVGSGVLLRAAEPVSGEHLLQRNAPNVARADLCRGPGRLARALGVDRRFDGLDLLRGRELWLAEDGCIVRDADVGVSTRIGIRLAAERPLRFYLRGHAGLSGPKRLNA